jgi:hypothetical protein
MPKKVKRKIKKWWQDIKQRRTMGYARLTVKHREDLSRLSYLYKIKLKRFIYEFGNKKVQSR